MQNSAIGFVPDAGRRHSSSPSAVRECRALLPVVHSPKYQLLLVCEHQPEIGIAVAGRDFRIFVTISQPAGSSTGIAPGLTWDGNCRSSQPTSAMSRSATHTGISRQFRNCSNWLPNALVGVTLEAIDEHYFQPAIPHSAFLHRSPAEATGCQPAHDSGLPRRILPVAPVRRRASRLGS